MKDLPINERPREKALLYGTHRLSNTELIAILLRTGTQNRSSLELALDVLSQCGGLKGLSESSVSDLKKIKGIQPAKALHLLSAVELAKRITLEFQEQASMQYQIQTPEQAIQLWLTELQNSKQEHFVVVFLNTKMKVIDSKSLFLGSVDHHFIHPRDIFREAVRNNATKIILMHNHPSGDPEPSLSDVETTKQVMEVGKSLGIIVVDHIVLGFNRYISMKTQKLI